MGLAQPPTRGDIQRAIERELEHAYAKHGRERWGRHEAYAIILEELEEAWEAIKSDAPSADVQAELVQVAAMCYRYLETGDRYRDAPAVDRRTADVDTAYRRRSTDEDPPDLYPTDEDPDR